MSLTLSRYIARHFLLWFTVFFFGLGTVVFVADLLEQLRRAAVRTDIGFVDLLAISLLKLPYTIQELLPFAILFSAIMSFWRLTRSNELIVARSVGVSVWQFMTPAIAVAVLIGCFKITVWSPIAAATYQRYETLEVSVMKGQTALMQISNTGLWLRQTTPQGSAIIHAATANPDLTVLNNVMVLTFKADNSYEGRIDAPTAELETGRWRLNQAIRSVAGEPPALIGPFELATDFTRQKIQESFGRPETMSFWSLPSFIDLLQQTGFSALRHRLYFQSQLAVPLLLSAMILIGAAFSLRPSRRGGIGRMIAGGVAAGFLFYFLTDLVYALGLSARLPVMLAAWAPAVISTMLGVALLLHLEDG